MVAIDSTLLWGIQIPVWEMHEDLRCRRYRDGAEPRLTCLNPPQPPCQSSRSSPATARLPIHRHLPSTSPGLANAYFNPASALLRICSAGSSPIRPLVLAIFGSFLRLSAPFWACPPLPLAAKLWLPDPQLRPNAPSSPNLLFSLFLSSHAGNLT
jgi:hypothetical protein